MAAAAGLGRCAWVVDSISTGSSSRLATTAAVATMGPVASPVLAAINPNDSQDTTTTNTTNSNSNINNSIQRVSVAIVGAGASGLQCFRSLMDDYGLSPNDMIVLEARDRIGGRIYSTTHEIATPTTPTTTTAAVPLSTTADDEWSSDGSSTAGTHKITFSMDHGAAWVHGTGWERLPNGSFFPLPPPPQPPQHDPVDPSRSRRHRRRLANPVMDLLRQETTSAAALDAAATPNAVPNSNNGETTMPEEETAGATEHPDDNTHATQQQQQLEEHRMVERHLDLVVDGNPWMRPRTILHRKEDENTPGQQQQQQAEQLALFVAGHQLDDDSAKDRHIVQQALARHFSIMRQVHRVGTNLYTTGRGMETATTSLGATIAQIVESSSFRESNNQEQKSPDEDTHQMIAALTPFYRLLIECWYGSAVNDLQICEFTRDTESIPNQEDSLYQCEGDFIGPHCTLRRGMASVLQPLLQDGVRERVLLQHEVTRISCPTENSTSSSSSIPRADGTVVVLETANGLKIHADSCVVTIPAGCVKEAVNNRVFATALSDPKLQAISLLKMGSYKKVFLTFDRIFWPPKPAFVGMVRTVHTDDSDGDACETTPPTTIQSPLGNCLLFDNLWAKRGISSIEAVLFGDAGAWSISKSDTEIRNAVLAFMADAMGLLLDDLQEFVQSCHVTRWEEDPFSRGAYSSMALGALESHVEELRRPEWGGRLVFSGEATISECEGSVYAALYSGMNAAEAIHTCLTDAPP